MKLKDLMHLFVKYLRSIPVEVPLHAEELLLESEDGKSTSNKKLLLKKNGENVNWKSKK